MHQEGARRASAQQQAFRGSSPHPQVLIAVPEGRKAQKTFSRTTGREQTDRHQASKMLQ